MLSHAGDFVIINQTDGDMGILQLYDGVLHTTEYVHSGSFALSNRIDGDANILQTYDGELTNFLPVITGGEVYTGDYEVVSFCAEVTTSLILPCKEKVMRKNVTIYSVPTTEQPNEAGGVTFEIGG